MQPFLPGYEGNAFYGIGAPKNTPAEIINKLNEQTNAGLADPEIKQRLTDLGGVPTPMSPAEFRKLIANETEKWAKVWQQHRDRSIGSSAARWLHLADAAFVDPAFKARLAELGTEPFASSPAEFGEFIVEYTEKWAKVIKVAGIKAE